MRRFVRIPITVLACVVYAGLALAQTSAPAAPPPTAGQTGGRGGPGGFATHAGRDWSARAGPAGGRHSAAHAGGADAGQRRDAEASSTATPRRPSRC